MTDAEKLADLDQAHALQVQVDNLTRNCEETKAQLQRYQMSLENAKKRLKDHWTAFEASIGSGQ